jgi:hypothetical protein
MKIIRSVNRRGFGTESMGFYTLLRPNKWFAASGLPGSFHLSRAACCYRKGSAFRP